MGATVRRVQANGDLVRGVRMTLQKTTGRTRGNAFPHSLTRQRARPHVYWAFEVALLTENQRALPVFWKCPLLLVGRQGLEPWTR